jgi:hypothetical protein
MKAVTVGVQMLVMEDWSEHAARALARSNLKVIKITVNEGHYFYLEGHRCSNE